MQKFTHFENGNFVSENTYRKLGYISGDDISDIFTTKRVVLDFDSRQILAALEDGECLQGLDLYQYQIEDLHHDLIDYIREQEIILGFE
jgi:hypothetical protein